MNVLMMNLSSFLFMVVFGAQTQVPSAQQVQLRFHPEVGKSLHYTGSGSLTIETGGQKHVANQTSTDDVQIIGPTPAGIRMAISTTSKSADGTSKPPFKFEVTVSELAKVVDFKTDDTSPGVAIARAGTFALGPTSIGPRLPQQPVKPGETWEDMPDLRSILVAVLNTSAASAPEDARPSFSAPAPTTKTHYRLVSVETKDHQRLATIEATLDDKFDLNVKPPKNAGSDAQPLAMPATVTLTDTHVMDLDTGVTVTDDFTFRGAVNVADSPLAIEIHAVEKQVTAVAVHRPRTR
jgi:hypothetical protein